MKQLILLALLASACGHKASSSEQTEPTGPRRTTEPSLGEQAQSQPQSQQARPVRSTVDPPLGGWSTPSSPPPTTTTSPAAAPTATTKPTTATSTATTPATPKTGTTPATTPPPATPPQTPTSTLTTAQVPGGPVTIRAKPPATPNSCAKGHECMITFAPAAGAPAATGKGSVKGQLKSDTNVPACPIDLVDGGTRRVSSGTAHQGAYEITAAPGHYSVSFERCLGCNPGLVDVEIVDGATATVSLTCTAVAK